MAVDQGFRRVVRLELHACNFDAEQAAVGQTRLVNGKPGAGLVAMVKVDLAAVGAGERRTAAGIECCGGIGEPVRHRLFRRLWACEQELVSQHCEPRGCASCWLLRAASD